MTAATVVDTPHPPPSPARVWFGILGAPAAWAGQGLLAWFVSGVGCESAGAGWFSPETARSVEYVVCAAAFAVAASAFFVGLAAWRRSGNRGVASLQAYSRPDYLAASALLVSFAFVIAVVLTSIPQFILPMCQAAR